MAADLRITGQALSLIETGGGGPTLRLLLDIGERLKDAGILDHLGGILEFMDAVGRALRARGVDVVNGERIEGERGVDLPNLDDVVARVYEDHAPQRELVPLRVITLRRKRRH